MPSVRPSPSCEMSVPIRSASSMNGRSAREFVDGMPGKLTAFRMTPSRRKSRTRERGLDADLFLRLDRRRGDVRRGDDLRQLGEPPVGRRLGSNTSRPAPATWPRFDRVRKRGFVNQFAARRVHDSDTRLAPRQPGGVEKVPGLRGRRQVQRDVVRGRAEIVERQQLDAKRGGHLFGDERIVGHQVPSRTRAPACRPPGRSGRARRFRASCRAARAGQLLLVPDALLHRRVGRRNRARQRQHQRDRQLGDADAVRAGGVHDEDAAFGCGGNVDVVDAGAGAGNHPQTRRRPP